MNLKSQRALHIFLASVFLLIGCDVSTFTSPQQIPTPIPGAINLIAGQTAAAAATETAALLPPTLTPTLTPFPTQTPPDTPTVTPTFIFYLVSPTPSAISGTLACTMISQIPQDGANFHTNKAFTLSWQLSNSGTGAWPQDSVSLKYVDGQQFSSVTIVNLPKTIVPGNSVTLTVDMTTPSKTGKYTADWTLADGSQTFCPLYFRITVK